MMFRQIVQCDLLECASNDDCTGEVTISIDTPETYTWQCYFKDGTTSTPRGEIRDIDSIQRDIDFIRTPILSVRLFIERARKYASDNAL